MRKIIYNSLILLFIFVSSTVIAQKNKSSLKNKVVQPLKEEPVLLIINNEKITKEDFLNVYRKNNVNSQVMDKKSLEEYLELYINFKLKVAEAKEMGLDTLTSFKTELSGYRDQLAQPYLTDKEVTDELMNEAYERMKWDIRASHILIKLNPKSSPEDTLKAYNKIMKIRERIIKGEDFGKVAQEESEDPSAKDNTAKNITGNSGDLGYFTVFDMIYPFESAAYKLKIGEVSKPVRTDYGYHLIKVTDKLPAMGKVQVAHIFVSIPKEVDEPDSLRNYEKRIKELYSRLINGEKFEEVAKNYSDDKGSASKGGLLPAFTVNRIVPEFITAVNKLEKDKYSEPVRTSYGWHIIKLVERNGIPSFEEKKADIKSRIGKDKRSEKSMESFIAKVKKENNFKEDVKAKKEFLKVLTDSVFEGKWKASEAKDLKKSLFVLGDTNITQQDFAKYIAADKGVKEKVPVELFLDNTYKQFVEDFITYYENKNLEKKYNDFRLLMQEYRDGILLFDLTDKKVWTKAVKDTAGLEKFYQQNKHKYMYDERVKTVTYTLANEKATQQFEKLLKKNIKKPLNDKQLLAKFNKDTNKILVIDTAIYQKGDSRIADSLGWKPVMSQKIKKDDKFAYVKILGTIAPEPKPLNEVRGLITAEYQNYLEKEWIAELKRKYPVVIKQDVLKSIHE